MSFEDRYGHAAEKIAEIGLPLGCDLGHVVYQSGALIITARDVVQARLVSIARRQERLAAERNTADRSDEGRQQYAIPPAPRRVLVESAWLTTGLVMAGFAVAGIGGVVIGLIVKGAP